MQSTRVRRMTIDAASADSLIALIAKWSFYAFNSATFLQSSRIAFGITLRQYCLVFPKRKYGVTMSSLPRHRI
jgi:hypothetical protein